MKTLSMAFLAAGVFASSAALARDYPQTGRLDYDARVSSPYLSRGDAPADRTEFDRSGTRGRLGLGVSPFHPEGPGNVSG